MHSITHHEEEKEKMRKYVSKKQNRIQVLQWGQLPLKKQNRKWVLPAGGKWFRKRLSSNLVGMTMNALKPFDLEIPPPEIYLKAITMNVFKDLNVICNSNKKKRNNFNAHQKIVQVKGFKTVLLRVQSSKGGLTIFEKTQPFFTASTRVVLLLFVVHIKVTCEVFFRKKKRFCS